MTARNKRGTLFGFTVAAALLALSSAAFACTIYRGEARLTGNASANQNYATADTGGMRYCIDPENQPRANMTQLAGVFTVFAGPVAAHDCDEVGNTAPASQVADGPAYRITYLADPTGTGWTEGTVQGQLGTGSDCMMTGAPGSAIKRISNNFRMTNGLMDVPGNTVVTTPENFGPGHVVVCVTHPQFDDNAPMTMATAI